MTQKKKKVFNEDLVILQRVFSSLEGKFVLKGLMRDCFFITSTHCPENANEMFFREGKRSVVMDLINTLGLNPQQVYELTEEIIQEEFLHWRNH